jgi:probable biosynthetic protein (TIGR04098 family)
MDLSMRDSVELTNIVAALTRASAREVSLDRWPTDYGLDSMSLLVFREECERTFKIIIPDEQWGGFGKLADILDFVGKRTLDAAETSQREEVSAGNQHWNASDLVERVEIGMPLTGINQLSESALLKHLGDMRWRHITKLTGVSSKNLVDDRGARLYPAFFYVDVQFPPENSIATFGENDSLELVDTVARFGSSLLDGVVYLIPQERKNTLQQPLAGMADAIARSVPAVRLSNVFVMQFNGAEWLRKSRPREELIAGIPLTETPPDSYMLNKRAEETGLLAMPGESFVSLNRELTNYAINVDRDVNGVGLLYFANYPVFLDAAERAALKSARFPLDDAVINRRSVISRKIAYLNNAFWRDSVQIESQIWISNPFFGNADPDLATSSVRIFSNQVARRCSDGRPICVSSCEKVLHGIGAQEIPWVEEFRPRRAT